MCLNGIKGSKKGESLQEDERKGCPSTSRTEESTEVIQKRLAKDRTCECLDVRRNDRDQ
jgi:hypothetical protein